MADEYNYDEHKSSENVATNILAALSSLAMQQKLAERAVEEAELKLAEAKAELVRISEREIPELMDAAEVTTFTTKDGILIKIKEKIRGSIPKDNEDRAFKWLKDHQHDDLIKREFKIVFGKKEEEWAEAFHAELKKREKPLAFEIKRTIHPSTLSSFVASQLEQGVDFPMDTFGVFRQRASVIEVK